MMDSFLLYRDSSTDGKKGYYSGRDVIKDLNLDILFRTMARGDYLIAEKVRKVILIPLETPEEIAYRQEILRDLYDYGRLLEGMYDCAVRQEKALLKYKEEKEQFYLRSANKTGEILATLEYLAQGQEELVNLQKLMEGDAGRMRAEGLKNLLARLQEMPLAGIWQKLQDMEFFVSGGEISYTVQFGGGMKIDRAAVNYCENGRRQKSHSGPGSIQRFLQKYVRKNTLSITNDVALREDINHMTEFTMECMLKMFHPYLGRMLVFFEHFIEETAFYMGAVKFMKRMGEVGLMLSMPIPRPAGTKDTAFEKLYELSMAIYVQKMPVTNDFAVQDNVLTLVTGANQGGKSTFLRSYGIAQVLMQCGMPVPAASFCAPIYSQIFTHFTRRESEQMDSGRLQEELKRMSDMVGAARPNSLFLLNESFASTTEKEGSRIAGAILRAFYEKGITTYMVTHLFQLASELYAKRQAKTTFLTAERQEDGTRTYRMIPGEPGYTSYGTDLFKVLEESF